MEISSQYAVLNVTQGRQKLLQEVGELGNSKYPLTCKRVPVVIYGYVEQAENIDNKFSQDFLVDVFRVDVQKSVTYVSV